MFKPSAFRELVSGRRTGIGPVLLRGGLRMAETAYTAAVRWRNRRYDRGAAPIYHAAVPVVSVGNLSLGGTGKTPMVEWLAKWFQARGRRVAILSRGYRATADSSNDEAQELARQLPDVPHLQNPDRVAAAQQAVAQFDAQVLLLDDGFQHRRLARNLDIVLLDAFEPFGFQHVFPRGTLREPLAGLSRAHVVTLTRADALDISARNAIWNTVRHWAPQAVCAEAVHVPWGLLSAGGAQESLATIRGQAVAAFCGIGNPTGFWHTLNACDCRLVACREFPDHHRYTANDRAALVAWARQLDVTAVVCTQKDLVKLDVDELAGRPLWAVGVEMGFLTGQEAFAERLQHL